ncbi:hypothetical protein [Bradyrhizobium sp. STM 3561]|uniref:hypothetical protein n=1 Tax=Bradyrhizobium sp. STM 3561 TaxID=578923 RepID=UPI00388E0318
MKNLRLIVALPFLAMLAGCNELSANEVAQAVGSSRFPMSRAWQQMEVASIRFVAAPYSNSGLPLLCSVVARHERGPEMRHNRQ